MGQELPEEVQTMIWRFSAMTDEVQPTSLADSYLEIKSIRCSHGSKHQFIDKRMPSWDTCYDGKCHKNRNFWANRLWVAQPFSVLKSPFIKATSMASYNTT